MHNQVDNPNNPTPNLQNSQQANSSGLTEAEKTELVLLYTNPAVQTLFKLMRTVVDSAAREAIETDPALVDEQRAKTTVAHAMNRFLVQVQNGLIHSIIEHKNRVLQKEQELLLRDQQAVEEFILNQ